jgi:hypothetical protein
MRFPRICHAHEVSAPISSFLKFSQPKYYHLLTFLCHCLPLSDHSPAPRQCPVFLFERSHKGMCPHRDCTSPLWHVRPVAQAATRSVRPCVGNTGASYCPCPHTRIALVPCRLAPLLIGMPSAKPIPTPQCIRLAGLPILPRRLATSSRLRSFRIGHCTPKMWHAVYKVVPTPTPAPHGLMVGFLLLQTYTETNQN